MVSLPMYGKPRMTSGSDGSCGCCGEWYGKSQSKAREERQWRRDLSDETKPSSELDPELNCYSWVPERAWDCE